MQPSEPINRDLLSLGDAFWRWRADTQPLSGDDIPRIERPLDWAPDWSRESVEHRRQQLAEFERELNAMAPDRLSWSTREQVDFRLLGSALARVRWELDLLRSWQRDPHFYVHQTLGTVFEALLQPPPFDRSRTERLVRLANSIPATLDAARVNLADEAVQPFAERAIAALADAPRRLLVVVRELSPLLDASRAQAFAESMQSAGRALETFREWLLERSGSMQRRTPIGRDRYVDFLTRVALVPLSPEQIMASARQELERAVSFETLEVQRNRALPAQPLPVSQAEQIAREAAGEQMLRTFCEEQDLLSFPDWLRHYRNLPLPGYLEPLRGLGVTDDLTSARRLEQDGTSYIPKPTPDLPYFYLAMARDPRTLIAHEGVHYYQLARAWAQPDPIRRFYYDSGPNEGIGFYAEEMLLQAGLFDDAPRSREIIYNLMRLRAVRVDVDIRLALGELTIDAAADELARRVPMDAATANEEADFFASDPGQAITYQVGKLQILGFLADARQAKGDSFNLRAFHDALFENGNVPIALQRWELLGADDQIALLDRAAECLPT
jgi:hypothetical protein